jgi:hypothetical protein
MRPGPDGLLRCEFCVGDRDAADNVAHDKRSDFVRQGLRANSGFSYNRSRTNTDEAKKNVGQFERVCAMLRPRARTLFS